MVNYRAKLDSALRDIHTSFLDLNGGNTDRVYPLHSAAVHGGPVSVLLEFGADLAGIEARGFRTRWVEDTFARGDIALEDLEAVASHPDVIQLAYGTDFKPLLDTSAVEIHARGKTGSPGVWTVDTATGAFGGNQGADVLIGIIDTGIDINHPVFLKPGITNTTRIRRIWDMGIDPHDNAKRPDVSLIQGGFTYGVEYTEQMINDVLQKKPGANVKHKDCFGHGTHVASIAAGDGRAPRGKQRYQFVGVAPGADLIVVKMLFLEKDPVENGAVLSAERLMEDAISYIERVAKRDLEDRPVVINVSLGTEIGPHDGLGAFERRLASHFSTATRKALVAAAGNEADSQQHAMITIPPTKTIDVPFTLFDERIQKTDRARCGDKPRPNAEPELEIQFWYQLGLQETLTSALTLPGEKIPRTGPALFDTVDGTYRGKQPFQIKHELYVAPRPPGPFAVSRNVLRIKVTPNANKFGTGLFTLKLTAPAGTEIHAWCTQRSFPAHGFRLVKALENRSTLSSPGTSAGAITVANYNDHNRLLVSDSSHGPLADYSGDGPFAVKPDLAAPGFEIEAATGSDSLLRAIAKMLGLGKAPYAHFSGTSAAAPHVAGVAALMFEKNPNLSRADLVNKLLGHARPAQPGDPAQQGDEFGAGRVDAKASRDAS